MNKKISTPLAIGIILILVIIVGGFTWWQYSEIEKEEAEVSEVQTPEKEEVKDETAGLPSIASATEGWQTYRNEEYGFEVKYPTNDYSFTTGLCHSAWFAEKENCISIKFSQNDECSINIAVVDKNKYENCLNEFEGIVGLEIIDFAGVKATKWPSINSLPFNYCVQKNDKYFVIFETNPYISSHRNPDEPLLPGCPSELNQILSTFKFIKD